RRPTRSRRGRPGPPATPPHVPSPWCLLYALRERASRPRNQQGGEPPLSLATERRREPEHEHPARVAVLARLGVAVEPASVRRAAAAFVGPGHEGVRG